jgi:hypothetical protein
VLHYSQGLPLEKKDADQKCSTEVYVSFSDFSMRTFTVETILWIHVQVIAIFIFGNIYSCSEIQCNFDAARREFGSWAAISKPPKLLRHLPLSDELKSIDASALCNRQQLELWRKRREVSKTVETHIEGGTISASNEQEGSHFRYKLDPSSMMIDRREGDQAWRHAG